MPEQDTSFVVNTYITVNYLHKLNIFDNQIYDLEIKLVGVAP